MRFRYLLLLALLIPFPAFADDPPPLSPFVQQILDRAFVGAQFVEGIASTDDCEDNGVKQNALDIAADHIRTFIDTETLLAQQTKSLKTMTICQRYDLLLIERRLRQMQDHIAELADGCNLNGMKTLAVVHAFLADGYKSVIAGGLDPAFTDFRLRYKTYWFGDTESPDAAACPFTTDYAPMSLVDQDGALYSYGCDEEKLQFVRDQDVPEAFKSEVEQELNAKQQAHSTAQTLFDQIYRFEQIFTELLTLIRGANVDVPPLPEARTPEGHRSIAGCKENKPDELTKVEVWERRDLPSGLTLTPTYDTFSIYKNSFTLLRDFTTVREGFGLDRPLPYWLKSETGTYLQLLNITGLTQQWHNMAAEQDRRSATIEAADSDPVEKMIHVAEPLRKAVLKFGYISSFPDPVAQPPSDIPFLPSYVRDVAYFLRRSCTYGVCTPLLDSILKRALDPNCFPYGSQQDIYCAHFKCFDMALPQECSKDKWNDNLPSQ